MKLVVAEKPSVGAALAKALGACEKKKGYIEGDNLIVSWCVGHLVELADADAYDEHYCNNTLHRRNGQCFHRMVGRQAILVLGYRCHESQKGSNNCGFQKGAGYGCQEYECSEKKYNTVASDDARQWKGAGSEYPDTVSRQASRL